MKKIIQNLNSSINQFTLIEGINQTNIPYLEIYKSIQEEIILPDKPNPFIYLVINGTMQIHFDEDIKEYAAGQYLIATMDCPRVSKALSVSVDNPFIAISVEFSVDDVVSVMLDIDGNLPEKLFDEEYSNNIQQQADEKILNVVCRLLNMNNQIDELSFMAKHLKREIIFDIITGLYGKQFLQNIVRIQLAGEIYNINSWIKQNYKDTFSVEDLAEQSNMSLSSFHQKFKSAIGMGPLQCQKKLRLMEARRFMLDKGANVTDAAMEVGYESVSQFIRDYRRMFGRSPQKDIQVIRESIQNKL